MLPLDWHWTRSASVGIAWKRVCHKSSTGGLHPRSLSPNVHFPTTTGISALGRVPSYDAGDGDRRQCAGHVEGRIVRHSSSVLRSRLTALLLGILSAVAKPNVVCAGECCFADARPLGGLQTRLHRGKTCDVRHR